jgi:hypothetical protein
VSAHHRIEVKGEIMKPDEMLRVGIWICYAVVGVVVFMLIASYLIVGHLN